MFAYVKVRYDFNVGCMQVCFIINNCFHKNKILWSLLELRVFDVDNSCRFFFCGKFMLCIIPGVSYLSRSQEDEALSRLNSIYNGKWQSTGEIKDVPLGNVADILFSERMKNHLSEWHDMLLLNRKAVLPTLPSAIESKQQFETIFLRMRPALRLNGFTSHQLKLIELVIFYIISFS